MVKKKKMFLGYELKTGKEVAIEIFHTLFTGQTQKSGKTTTMRALATQAVKYGFKILVLDTKSQIQDYEGFGQQIPICLNQSTDALILRDLLESINDRKISKLQSTLIEISEDTTSFEEVLAKAENMKEKLRSGFKKDACIQLIDLMKRLIEQTKKVKTTIELELPYPINRMTINDFELPGQQLIVNTVFEQVLKKFPNTIILLDEAHKFLPEGWGSPCKQRVQSYVTQGAATGDFLWMSTQFMATTSKMAMKAMPVKLLGRQDHITEVDDTLEMAPGTRGRTKGKINKDFIMGLKIGHFILVTTEGAKVVYVCPEHADKNECIEVALGLRGSSEIHYVFAVSAEDYYKIRKKIQPKRIPQPKLQPMPPPEIIIDEPKPKTEPAKQPETPEKIETKTKPDEPDTIVRIGVNEIENIEKQIHQLQRIVTGKEGVDLTMIEKHVKITKKPRHVTISDDTMRGKILFIAKNGFFNAWHPLREVVAELQNQRWTVNSGRVKTELLRMANDGYLGLRKRSRENYYALSPNVIFEE